MPAPSSILEGLSTISRENEILAVFWHLYFAGLILGIILGWRPSKRIATIMLILPLFSVGILAGIYNNPFNAVSFFLFAVSLALIGLFLPKEKVKRGPLWSVIAGIIMIFFGWIYPHFLEDPSWWNYLYKTPAGLIPCPTLSITIGFALLTDGLSSRIWPFLFSLIGIFYGLFGFIRLGVDIDIILFIGSLILLIKAFTESSEKAVPVHKEKREKIK